MAVVKEGEASGRTEVLDPRFPFGGDFDAEAELTDLRISSADQMRTLGPELLQVINALMSYYKRPHERTNLNVNINRTLA